jgi:hypothetical protein
MGVAVTISDRQNGKKYLQIIFILMFLVSLIEIIAPMSFIEIKSQISNGTVTMILLIAWFYSIDKGYSIAKWLFVSACTIIGIYSIDVGYYDFMNGKIYYDNSLVIDGGVFAVLYSIHLVVIGIIKIIVGLYIALSKNLNRYFSEQREKRGLLSKAEYFGNFISGFGFVFMACCISWFLMVSLVNTHTSGLKRQQVAHDCL